MGRIHRNNIKLTTNIMNNRPNGCIVWEGKSEFDGSPIVLLLTGLELPSQNRKTGPVVQSYIVRSDITPLEAVKTRLDCAICGNCAFRKDVCYVDMRPINNIWRVYKRGGYPRLTKTMLARVHRRRKVLRLGSYGDPAAVPLKVWETILSSFGHHTGYTHAWRFCHEAWRKYLMASVESQNQALLAQSMGWRTFRVKLPNQGLLPGEVHCTNLVDDSLTCEDCRLCDGTNGKSPVHVADNVHGLTYKVSNFSATTSCS